LNKYYSQGNAATYLRRDGSFNSGFLCRSCLNLTVKKYENWSTFGEVILKIKVAYVFETCIRLK